MIKSLVRLSVVAFVTAQWLYASDQNPITAEVAQLQSPVITIVAEGFLTFFGLFTRGEISHMRIWSAG